MSWIFSRIPMSATNHGQSILRFEEFRKLKQNFEPTAPAREQPAPLKEKYLSGKFASKSGTILGKLKNHCVACHYWGFPSNICIMSMLNNHCTCIASNIGQHWSNKQNPELLPIRQLVMVQLEVKAMILCMSVKALSVKEDILRVNPRFHPISLLWLS